MVQARVKEAEETERSINEVGPTAALLCCGILPGCLAGSHLPMAHTLTLCLHGLRFAGSHQPAAFCHCICCANV